MKRDSVSIHTATIHTFTYLDVEFMHVLKELSYSVFTLVLIHMVQQHEFHVSGRQKGRYLLLIDLRVVCVSV